MDVTAAIGSALRQLAEEFDANELAAVLLESKSEARLCDALASRLGALLADQPTMQVEREWRHRKSRVDIAVTCEGDPVALVEAKVAKSFDLVVDSDRRYPSGEVRKDVKKMQGVKVRDERFALLFVVHNHQVPHRRHDAKITYSDALRRHGVIDNGRIDDGFERFRQAVGEVDVCVRGSISAGTACEVDVSLLYWLLRVGAGRANDLGFRPFPKRGAVVTNEFINRLRADAGD